MSRADGFGSIASLVSRVSGSRCHACRPRRWNLGNSDIILGYRPGYPSRKSNCQTA
jgi:hypothetical protein